jgi:hypothetical protein
MASSTGTARANGLVWEVRGDVVKPLAQRGGAEVNGAGGAAGALDVPVGSPCTLWRARARHWHVWAS